MLNQLDWLLDITPQTKVIHPENVINSILSELKKIV